jgi:hypothetical protein
VGLALIEKLTERGAFVLCAAVSRQPVHLLVKMPPKYVRQGAGTPGGMPRTRCASMVGRGARRIRKKGD